MSAMNIGQKERITQNRIVAMFRDELGYDYLGNWEDRPNNRNIETEYLRRFLERAGHERSLIDRAIFLLDREATDSSKSLYDRNKAVYSSLRYGIKVKAAVGESTQTVWLIDWKTPTNNDFGIAEEVTVSGSNPAANRKRPDLVLYVNGIALGVIELKRSIVSVAEGIRQNLDNQKKVFIESFFSTAQVLAAGNDTEGLRYGTIQTPEKYYLTWKEEGSLPNPLDLALTQLCEKHRLLELIHDFVVFDSGTKKLCRHNQYNGVKAAQANLCRGEGGIIWHTQGSGKSLTMVWLAKWIRENLPSARVLIITDRTELDQQIEGVFNGVNEHIYRAPSGADLIATLNSTTPWLICSLIHKFGGKTDPSTSEDHAHFLEDLTASLPSNFEVKGNLFVFVDECHRTQSGDLHKAMKALLSGAVFIGFTGTPLLKTDKQKTIDVFGGYIHTYKFDEAVRDKVVLDLRYEARDIDQHITSQGNIDQWFEVKTKGLNDVARAELKKRWGTMKKVLSSQDRLRKIVADVLMDMETRDRLRSGRGNAMLVSGSIYQACRVYEMFGRTDLRGRCAIITSYIPNAAEITGEESGEGLTERLRQFDVYRQMLADWFNQPVEDVAGKVELFERQVKEKFIKEPGQMKLLIVVDKLLTGFDAPPATYLYIDKQMRDHGLFQAICRVNRLDGDDKEYGYIVDYKDLFRSLEGAVHDYTSDAFEGYDKEDVAGLLENRLDKARERLEEVQEVVRALCEPVEPPKDSLAYLSYFCAAIAGNAEMLKDNEPKRLSLYKNVAEYVRAYAAIANEMEEAGFTPEETSAIKAELSRFEKVREEVKLASGDYIDLKMYEPAMRHLIDSYIRAEDSRKLASFDDIPLVQLLVTRGAEAINALPAGLRESPEAMAETIENNVRRLIIDEQPINPKYYDRMSQLLDALIAQRRREALEYRDYIEQIVRLAKDVISPGGGSTYPKEISSRGKRALYDNLGSNSQMALAVDTAIIESRQDDWRANPFKVRMIRRALVSVLGDNDQLVELTLELVKNQDEY